MRCQALSRAAAAAAFLICAGPAAADSTGPPGLDQVALYELESRVLGPSHAAEHARQRAAMTAAPSEGAEPDSEIRQLDPALGGHWLPPFDIPILGIHAIMLPTGKVMWFSYPQNPTAPYGNPDAPNTAQAWLWDPATGRTRRVDAPLAQDPETGQMQPANIWCAGHALLPDGRVLVVGGNLGYERRGDPPLPNFAGLNKVYTFNPWNETWTEQPDMPHGRWYPTVSMLADGRALIMAGFDETGSGYSATNTDVELFTSSPDLDGVGTLTKIADRDGTPPDGDLYPHMFLMPSGRTLIAGPNLEDTWSIDAVAPFAWSQVPDPPRRRLWGSGVLLPGSTKAMLLGGSQPNYSTNPPSEFEGVATTSVFDEQQPATGWQAGSSMQIGRSHLNTVLLPDGSMLTVGGGIGRDDAAGGQWAAREEHKQVEIYDPVTDTWRLGSAQAENRAYHSTALLLPDGHVISAGDDYHGGTARDTAEIYEPPYLFGGPRPAITSAPDAVGWSEQFEVGTTGLVPVTGASLVAPSAVTHANDMSQRVVPLALEQVTNGVRLTAPATATAAPPGWYMLFLLSDQGVPSLARWVQLGQSLPALGQVEIEARTDPAGASTSFPFAGGPFGEFELRDGEAVSARVPPGRYPVTELATPGWDLKSVVCSDGSPGSVGERRATAEVSPGETVRCVFTSAPAPPGAAPEPGGPAPEPGGPAPGDAAPDRVGPVLGFNRRLGVSARRGVLRGSASDPSGVERVDVALGMAAKGRCRWWSRRKRGLSQRRARCGRPAWMGARLTRSVGGVDWSLALRRRIPPGRYVVALRAEDGLGNVSSRTGRSAVRVRVRR